MRKILSPLITLPTPSNITYAWRGGRLLGLALMVQILTGLIMTITYVPDISMAFQSVNHLIRDSNIG